MDIKDVKVGRTYRNAYGVFEVDAIGETYDVSNGERMTPVAWNTDGHGVFDHEILSEVQVEVKDVA